MFFLQSPPPTRFDLRFTLFGISVRVHPLFWIIPLLISSSSPSLTEILVWALAVFISVLVHEMGHALAMRFYGQRSQIVLHAMGGLTIPESVAWGTGWASVARAPNQEILITAAGPAAGFAFAALLLTAVHALGGMISVSFLFGFIPIPQAHFSTGILFLDMLIAALVSVNVFWGFFNLLPVYPLDGGQIARHVLLLLDRGDGARKSLWLSVIIGGLMALAGILYFHSIFMTLMFGMMAFQSYQMLQGAGMR
ncbi:MAG: site-2 protease family protein [Anaerolineales bacterium]